MKNLKIALTVLLVLSLTACGDANPMITTDGYGFWAGLWDGLTIISAFIYNVFGGDSNIYNVANNGNWYNFGYLIGVSTTFGGSTVTIKR